MATGLPDQEAQNEEQQTNELDVLNNTMSSVKDVLVAQLESLKSIARWQDQTALYTSHLQNIKTDMNQVRKWGSHIEQIAQRVDVIATRLSSDASPQSGDDKPSEDATVLLPTLNLIEANTRMTVEAIQVLADATREGQEDKREVVEKVKPEKQPKDKKAETGVRKHMSEAMTGVRDFFSKIISWFAMAALLIAPLMVGPDQLFGNLKEFFGHLKKFFAATTKFFLENVVPAISFLMEKLTGFFNELAGPLGRLGTELGNALRLVGPKLWNVLSPILDSLGVGIIKAVDFFTVVLGKIGPALDVIGGFVQDIFAKFSGADELATSAMKSISDFFERIMDKMNAMDDADFMENMTISLQSFFNLMMDCMATLVKMMIKFYARIRGLDADDEELKKLVADFYDPLIDAKFNIDRSSQKSSMIDFNKPEEDVINQINKAEANNLITPTEAQTMKENMSHFKGRQAQREEHSLGRIKSIKATTAPGVDQAMGFQVKVVEVSGLKGAIPGFKDDVAYFSGFEGIDGGEVDYGRYHKTPEAAFAGAELDVVLDPQMAGLVQNVVQRGSTEKGAKLIGKDIPIDDRIRDDLQQMDFIDLQKNLGNSLGPAPVATGSTTFHQGNKAIADNSVTTRVDPGNVFNYNGATKLNYTRDDQQRYG